MVDSLPAHVFKGRNLDPTTVHRVRAGVMNSRKATKCEHLPSLKIKEM